MTSLLLIRHAQSEHHVRGFVGGWSDWPLSVLGRQQACALAARLRDEYGGVPCVLACSDLARAAQTTLVWCSAATGSISDATSRTTSTRSSGSRGEGATLAKAESRSSSSVIRRSCSWMIAKFLASPVPSPPAEPSMATRPEITLSGVANAWEMLDAARTSVACRSRARNWWCSTASATWLVAASMAGA